MSKPKDLVKIPGTFFSLIGRHSLWCAPDHLLSISNRGYTEEYRRFYYHEIQALYFRKSVTGMVINAILGAFALIFAANAAYSWTAHNLWAPFAIEILAFFLALLLINLFRGPTCVFFLRTAVNVQKLSSLGRIRKARKAISMLQPRIEAAQGILQPAQLPAFPPTGNIVLNPPVPASVGKPIVHEEGKVHAALYICLVIYGLAELWSLRTEGAAMTLIGGILFLLLVIFTIMSAVRQQNSDLTSGIKRSVYFTFALIAFRFLASYGLMFYALIDRRGVFLRPDEIIRLLFEQRQTSPAAIGIGCFSGAVSILIGVVGFILLQNLRRIRAFNIVSPGVGEGSGVP